MIRKLLFATTLAFAVTGAALANGPQVDAAAGVFTAQRAKVQADLADGETYSEISPADRGHVIAALDRMDALLAGRPVSALSESEKVALMNDQSMINTTLTQAGEDSRLVCRREAAVGSRLQRSQCLTVAERRRKREQSQDALGEFHRGYWPGDAFEP